MSNRPVIHSTTILCVRRSGTVVMAGDGQVTLGNAVLKANARKVRKLYGDRILAGFAGASADAFTLLERWESKIEAYRGNIKRASVELAKDWRTDRMLRRLEALLVVADRDEMYIISGTGDVIEPEEGIAAVGSGGSFAQAAATALLRHTDLPARAIVEHSLAIAGEICIYTNANVTVEELS